MLDILIELQICMVGKTLEEFLNVVKRHNFELTPARAEFLLVEAARLRNICIMQYLAKIAPSCTTALQFSILNNDILIIKILLDGFRDKIDMIYLEQIILPSISQELYSMILYNITPVRKVEPEIVVSPSYSLKSSSLKMSSRVALGDTRKSCMVLTL